MACYNPIAVSLSPVGPDGKRKIIFTPSKDGFKQIQIPCGSCVGCRISRARSWALRCVHEASLYDDNCFITLTYDDDHLKSSSLVKKDFQDFMKRLRREFPDINIRYYACGEYGELGRPHFHACLFNFDFTDKVLWKDDKVNPLYVSDILNERWGKGYCVIGQVTMDTAQYVAGYIHKKILGTSAVAEAMKIGVYQGREPEFALMSRRPGIGKKWLELYSDDVYPSDEIIIEGVPVAVPRYYDTLIDEKWLEEIKMEREKKPKVERWDYRRIADGKKSVDHLKEKGQSVEKRLKEKKRKII